MTSHSRVAVRGPRTTVATHPPPERGAPGLAGPYGPAHWVDRDHNALVRLLGACRHVAAGSRDTRLCWCGEIRARRSAEVPAERSSAIQGELAQLRAAVAATGAWWEPPPVAHNDAVRYLGNCPCRCHKSGGPCRCNGRTDPALARAFARADEQDLQRRLRSGRARPSEYLRHAPHLLPRRDR